MIATTIEWHGAGGKTATMPYRNLFEREADRGVSRRAGGRTFLDFPSLLV